MVMWSCSHNNNNNDDENIPCSSLNWWRLSSPQCSAGDEMATRLDVVAGRAGTEEASATSNCHTLVPWGETVTLENVRKFLAYFVSRQIWFFRNAILKFFARAFVFAFDDKNLLKPEVTSLIFAFVHRFLMSKNIRIGIFSLHSLLWHIIALYLALHTEVTFASHPTAYSISAMRPAISCVWFRSALAYRRHSVNIFSMNNWMLAE